MVCTHIDPHMAGLMGRCNDPHGRLVNFFQMSVTLTLLTAYMQTSLLGGPADKLKLSCSASIRYVRSPTRLAILRLVIIEQGGGGEGCIES